MATTTKIQKLTKEELDDKYDKEFPNHYKLITEEPITDLSELITRKIMYNVIPMEKKK